MFIDDLMKEHMTATFAKAPVVCYIPCSQCKKMHLDVEKATEKNSVYCPVNRVYADITDYHNILSGLYYQELMSHQRQQRSMKLTYSLHAGCHHSPISLLNAFHICNVTSCYLKPYMDCTSIKFQM